MNSVTAPQASVQVELAELPGGMGLAAGVGEDGRLTLLLNPQATPERVRDDLDSILGHFLDSGHLVWGDLQKPGLP
ncbi:hypothetical protein ACFVZH_22720 [Streptomyces sp. NPDC059534]|uniref:hypothetical protein n=1 Tax=Streptomyces sp. NPDC059534 TaxID=3346859 RepID=UPI0036D04914